MKKILFYTSVEFLLPKHVIQEEPVSNTATPSLTPSPSCESIMKLDTRSWVFVTPSCKALHRGTSIWDLSSSEKEQPSQVVIEEVASPEALRKAEAKGKGKAKAPPTDDVASDHAENDVASIHAEEDVACIQDKDDAAAEMEDAANKENVASNKSTDDAATEMEDGDLNTAFSCTPLDHTYHGITQTVKKVDYTHIQYKIISIIILSLLCLVLLLL